MLTQIFAFLLMLTSNFAFAQTARHSAADVKSWSTWIPVIDRNQSKVDISLSFSKTLFLQNESEDKDVYFYFKLKNGYKEPVSGRLLYDYLSTDGTKRQMNCVIYCLQPGEIYFNDFYCQKEVKDVSNFRFIEFNSCSKNSHLLSYSASDSTVYKLYSLIRKQAVLKQKLVGVDKKDYVPGSLGKIKEDQLLADNSSKTVYYKGDNQEIIKLLLSKVHGWKTNSGLRISDGIPPEIPVNQDCQRDHYVSSAILYAWAAESYYRIGEVSRANKASAKVSELIESANQFCDGRPSYIAGNCETENIYPCGSITVQKSIGTPVANSKPSSFSGATGETISNIKRKEDKTNASNSNAENELFSGLLPELSMLQGGTESSKASALAGIGAKVSSYVESDSTSSPIMKALFQLASLNMKMQLNELSTGGQSISSGSDLEKYSTLANNQMYTGGSGDMNSLQQQVAVENAVHTLLDGLADLIGDGIPKGALKRKDALTETIYKRNIEYREKYGYSVQDYTDAIRNFDDKLLNNILATGFPIDTKVIHDNIFSEIALIGVNYYGPDYYLNGLHYAAIYGNYGAAKILINKGLSIEDVAHGYKGLTSYNTNLTLCRAIDIAVLFDRYEVVKLLLDNRAETKHNSSLMGIGFTSPYHIAKLIGYYGIKDMLEKYPK